MVSGADSFLLYLIWWFQPTMSFMQVTVTGFNCSINFCLLRAKPKSSSTFSCRPKTQKSTICFLVCSPSRQKKKTVEKEIVVLFLFDKGQSENIFSSFLSSTSSGNWRLSTVVPLVWCVTTFDRYNRCTNAKCILSSQAGTKHPQQLSNTCSGPDCSKGR